MYTAKIVAKANVGGTVRFSVEFTDGTTTVMEQIVPQNEDSFKSWVRSRIAVFESSAPLDTTYNVEDSIDVTEGVVTPVDLTAAEIAAQAWLSDYTKWVKVRTTLIDTGILTGSETKVVELQKKVKDGFKVSYLDNIV